MKSDQQPTLERPDLSQVDAAVRIYVEALEAEVKRLSGRGRVAEVVLPEPRNDLKNHFTTSEPPSTLNVISVSAAGLAKRTPRHFYDRQRRGGMGVFDLDTREDDRPAFLTVADESQSLLLFTSLGRAFRLAVGEAPETPVRGRGQPLVERLPFALKAGERLAAILPEQGGAYVALVSQRGWVRRIRASYLGEKMLAGASFHDVKEGGLLAAACWTPGNANLFLATQQGQAIRFEEGQISARGGRGMRVGADDSIVAITAVQPDSGVFLLGNDGRGTIRLMSGFSANKAPGAGGKAAMKTDQLVAAVTVSDGDDLFIISRLGKIIRFTAGEVPPKEGVVQGVNCMSLRADETAAVAVTR